MPSRLDIKFCFKRLTALFTAAAFVLTSALPPALWSNSAAAQSRGPTIIRDSELEMIVRHISLPIFEAAGLVSENVHTYVIHDDSLNAFVAGGQNIFINTGLIMASDNVNQLVGVIAHETGHITGSHLARFQDGLKGASALSIAGLILGAAAIAMGGGDAGMAILLGSQEAAMRSVLAYSRTQEASADQAAIKFLDDSGQSGQGLVEFFEKLAGQEYMYTTNRDPYVRSHPLTRDRINALSSLVEQSPYRDAPNPPDADALFERMKAKLWGYFRPTYTTFRQYPRSDTSANARYARIYAYNRERNLDAAFAEAASLVSDYPNDGFFWEMQGFLLFQNGRIAESIEPFRRSVALLPREPLILLQLAQALIATEDPAYTREAIETLELANSFERDNPFAWHQLSIAYHQDGHDDMAHLAAAERFLLVGMEKEASFQARSAFKRLPKDTPSWLRAQDIMLSAAGGKLPDENGPDKKPPQKKEP